MCLTAKYDTEVVTFPKTKPNKNLIVNKNLNKGSIIMPKTNKKKWISFP